MDFLSHAIFLYGKSGSLLFSILPEEAGHPAPELSGWDISKALSEIRNHLVRLDILAILICLIDSSSGQFLTFCASPASFPIGHHLRGSVFNRKRPLLEQIYFLQQI